MSIDLTEATRIAWEDEHSWDVDARCPACGWEGEALAIDGALPDCTACGGELERA